MEWKRPGHPSIAKWNTDHGVSPTAWKNSGFPGVPVSLPNGSHIPDSNSPTGMLMAPISDLSNVAAAGKQTKKDVQQILANGDDGSGVAGYMAGALSATVATGGQFDYQRVGPQSDVFTGGWQPLPQFKDVANFNVGLFSQQAGLTLNETLGIARVYADLFSRPSGLDNRKIEFTTLGYNAGQSGAYGQ
jgi:hypothetical protein